MIGSLLPLPAAKLTFIGGEKVLKGKRAIIEEGDY
jgi:hypothetical protein